MSNLVHITRHALTGTVLEIAIRDGRIAAVSPSTADPGDRFIAPSFCDIQINGCHGIAFTSASLDFDGIRKGTDACHQHGIGQYFPTVITSNGETILHSFRTLAAAVEQDKSLSQAIPGFHLEGPYLSGEDGPRGAHPLQHIRDPIWDEFCRWQDTAGGRIKLVTLAPERNGAIQFIEQLTAAGVMVAIGHTAASGQQIQDAVQAGAKLSTHLGNGCAAVLPRHANPIWAQLAEDRLVASMIADGHHLPAAVMKSIVRGKTPSRLILTCDASPLAGLLPGKYQEWGQEFEVLPDGKVVVPGTPFLAGSGVFTDHCISHLLGVTDVSLAEAIEMASVRPRQLFGLPVPEVKAGTAMDQLILFRWKRGEPFQF